MLLMHMLPSYGQKAGRVCFMHKLLQEHILMLGGGVKLQQLGIITQYKLLVSQTEMDSLTFRL